MALLLDISKVYPAANALEIVAMIHDMVGVDKQGVCPSCGRAPMRQCPVSSAIMQAPVIFCPACLYSYVEGRRRA